MRLGTRYGGWWIDKTALGSTPFLIDCGLGEDISFPLAFIQTFGGKVIGIEPNPQSLAYCRDRCPPSMEIYPNAISSTGGQELTFHLPRALDQLPFGADGVSGSLVASHDYVTGGDTLQVTSISLNEILSRAGRNECDVLKLDIEGAEYDLLGDLCRTGDIRRFGQVLVEFHHGVTHQTLDDTKRIVRALESAKFQLMHTEGRNYIFRRNSRSLVH
jgi:FkbM family methyltransferase